MPSRVIYENTAHQLCGDSEKLRAALPVGMCLIDETKISLVDERSGLQRVPRMFASHVVVGEPAQLVVDQWYQLVERSLIAIGPIQNQLGYVIRGRRRFVNAPPDRFSQ